MFERCIYVIMFFVNSELSSPRCLNEKLFETPLRMRNVCDDGTFMFPKECL